MMTLRSLEVVGSRRRAGGLRAEGQEQRLRLKLLAVASAALAFVMLSSAPVHAQPADDWVGKRVAQSEIGHAHIWRFPAVRDRPCTYLALSGKSRQPGISQIPDLGSPGRGKPPSLSARPPRPHQSECMAAAAEKIGKLSS
jgi:hypothetical protein